MDWHAHRRDHLDARAHLHRRTLLKAAACSGLSWLTPGAEALAVKPDSEAHQAKSVILLWMAGGPRQLETFDPKPGSNLAGGTTAIDTRVPGIEVAAGYEQVADQMDSIALIRSCFSQEGDHERATYNVKTGFRPDPTLVHPAISAVLCHQLTDRVEIPRHVSILPSQ